MYLKTAFYRMLYGVKTDYFYEIIYISGIRSDTTENLIMI